VKTVPFSIIALAAVFLVSGCVRRTITSRPGWKDPSTGKLFHVPPNYEKTDESHIVWFWEPEFYKTREAFKSDESDDSSSR